VGCKTYETPGTTSPITTKAIHSEEKRTKKLETVEELSCRKPSTNSAFFLHEKEQVKSSQSLSSLTKQRIKPAAT
jgi:hypothetical protein